MKNKIKFLCSPKGRIRRMTFTNAWAAMVLIMTISFFIFPLSFIIVSPFVLLMPTIKRLHDVNMSGFYAVVIYQVYGLIFMQMNGMQDVEFFGYIMSMTTVIYYMMWPTLMILFYLGVKKGDNFINKYGDNPAWAVSPRVPLVEFLSWRGIALKTGEKYK